VNNKHQFSNTCSHLMLTNSHKNVPRTCRAMPHNFLCSAFQGEESSVFVCSGVSDSKRVNARSQLFDCTAHRQTNKQRTTFTCTQFVSVAFLSATDCSNTWIGNCSKLTYHIYNKHWIWKQKYDCGKMRVLYSVKSLVPLQPKPEVLTAKYEINEVSGYNTVRYNEVQHGPL
jgi:hypothetical protein